jgi:hypothetical protein
MNFILKDPALTPWTNYSLVAVPGYQIYQNRQTALADVCWNLFATTMNNMSLPFTFDYAVAIMK